MLGLGSWTNLLCTASVSSAGVILSEPVTGASIVNCGGSHGHCIPTIWCTRYEIYRNNIIEKSKISGEESLPRYNGSIKERSFQKFWGIDQVTCWWNCSPQLQIRNCCISIIHSLINSTVKGGPWILLNRACGWCCKTEPDPRGNTVRWKCALGTHWWRLWRCWECDGIWRVTCRDHLPALLSPTYKHPIFCQAMSSVLMSATV